MEQGGREEEFVVSEIGQGLAQALGRARQVGGLGKDASLGDKDLDRRLAMSGESSMSRRPTAEIGSPISSSSSTPRRSLRPISETAGYVR